MDAFTPHIDLSVITAIDFHVHVEVDGHGHAALPQDLVDAVSTYFSTDGPRPGALTLDLGHLVHIVMPRSEAYPLHAARTRLVQYSRSLNASAWCCTGSPI